MAACEREREKVSASTTQLHAAIIKIRSVNQIEFQCANYHWLNLNRDTERMSERELKNWCGLGGGRVVSERENERLNCISPASTYGLFTVPSSLIIDRFIVQQTRTITYCNGSM